MIYRISTDFTKIAETSGTMQNTGSCYVIEISNRPVKGSGLLLNPREKITFSGDIYARRTGTDPRSVELRVVPFYASQGGTGGSSTVPDSQVATDTELTDMMDEIFAGKQIATDDELTDMMDDVFDGGGSATQPSGVIDDQDINELMDDVFKP